MAFLAALLPSGSPLKIFSAPTFFPLVGHPVFFLNKEDDFDAIDWEFRFKGQALTLHYSIYNGISIFPTRTKDALNKDNKAVVELANALEGKLFNTGLRNIA